MSPKIKGTRFVYCQAARNEFLLPRLARNKRRAPEDRAVVGWKGKGQNLKPWNTRRNVTRKAHVPRQNFRILSHFVAFPSHFVAFPSHFVAFLFHPLPAITAYITCPYARFPVNRLSHFSHFPAAARRRAKNEERKTKNENPPVSGFSFLVFRSPAHRTMCPSTHDIVCA